ncbi:hypothetical protein BO94DRAFT_530633 [Aspergillus sclerotioniger CBS 115572]|uniref:RTA1 domain protein n=1 Tax=Aspergillus sclerotioniger CBS 115572 TaxID=1450535 RepID=A0A317XBH6_9EURO|nr:hypothetical protein BO94DRAFT_530633 [Aspergillus sclerotioniger CBS 115572]PWY95893.1 hypothetical protein BO94DRAFT_530633 [Aspergillus sclerotioniger CBS 115572]
MTVDFFSLLLQVIGGGVAGAAFSTNTSYWPGTYIMVAGIIWQLVSTCVFTTLLEYVIYRAMRQIIGNPPLRKITFALIIAVTCMVTRGVYRSMELINGWRGYLFTHEIYAVILDALVMFVANVMLNIWNPAVLIKEARAMGAEVVEIRAREEQDRKKRTSDEYQPMTEEAEPVFTTTIE